MSRQAIEQDLTLREALATERLDDFVRQEEARGVELVSGSELERALALLIIQHRRVGHRRSNTRPARMPLDNVADSL